jgi:hypothetical protein
MLSTLVHRLRIVARPLRFGVVLAALALALDCTPAPPPPRLLPAASCPAGRALPPCRAREKAVSVRELASAAIVPGSSVQVEGRLVPGARCCRDGCPPSCSVQLALVDETEAALTPSEGPLVFLTVADKLGQDFTTQLNAKLPVTCAEAERAGKYCCEADVSGQLVRVSGRARPRPTVTTTEPLCMMRDLDMPPAAPACQISASWRSDWSETRAVAVEEWCAFDANQK